MIGIYGKAKTDKRYKLFDYTSGTFVITKIRQTLWQDSEREHVDKLVEHMNNENEYYTFKVVTRR